MTKTLGRFEMKRLYGAVEQVRCDRELTWAGLVTEINEPFEGTPSIPISISTVRGMAKKSSVTSAVVLQILRWLRRTPESFVSRHDVASLESECLPEPGPGHILRFDTRAMHAAVDAERRKQGMTWKEVANELPGFSESMLTNLANGPLIGFPRVMLLTQWVGQPAASFVRIHRR